MPKSRNKSAAWPEAVMRVFDEVGLTQVAYVPDAEAGESFLPLIHRRPAKRILDLLEKAPDFAAVRRNLPDAL